MDEENKLSKIKECLNGDEVDLWDLRELALTRGGLVNSPMRKRAWKYFVGLQDDDHVVVPSIQEKMPAKNGSEWDLIRRDAGRSVLYRFYNKEISTVNLADSPITPSGELTSQGSPSFEEQQKDLTFVLEQCIAYLEGEAHYYQGLHDIAGVLMYNLTCPHLTLEVLRKLCQSHLCDAMQEDFQQLSWLLDRTLLPLVARYDRDVSSFLMASKVDMSNCCLPWVITWFTHSVVDSSVASRLVDAFLCAHPLLPVYVAAALLVHPLNKPDILCTECDDPAMVYVVVSGFPSRISHDWQTSSVDRITTQDLLDRGMSIMKEVPPRSLLKFAQPFHRDLSSEEISAQTRSLSVLHAPPWWSLMSTSPSGSTLRSPSWLPTISSPTKQPTIPPEEKEEEALLLLLEDVVLCWNTPQHLKTRTQWGSHNAKTTTSQEKVAHHLEMTQHRYLIPNQDQPGWVCGVFH